MNNLELARKYREFGFSVFPLIPKDKKPLIAWKKYQEHFATDTELQQWFDGTQNGIAIVTGPISDLIVLDADSEQTAQWVEQKGIGEGLRVKTAKGMHYYLKWQDGFRNAVRLKDLGGLDIRGAGGYVAAPGTIHPSGFAYAFVPNMPKALADVPEWLSESIEMIQANPSGTVKANVSEIVKGCEAGSRNDSLARFIGVVVKMVNFESALEVALNWNKTNIPPLPAEEVVETVKSIWQREQNKSGSVETSAQDVILYGQELIEKTKAYQEKGEEPALSTGWHTVDEYYKVRKKEWTLVTGIPGAGKTVWLDNMCLNMAKKYGWKFAVFSAENVPHERHATALSKLLGIEGDGGLEFIAEHFAFLSPNEDALTIEKILSLCDTLSTSRPFDGLIVDPWNELDSTKRGNLSETEHVSASLTKLRRYARTKNIHAWLVAHPTKLKKITVGGVEKDEYPIPTPYDVSGSAHFRNKADNCLSLWWNYAAKDGITKLCVQKIRFRECGQMGQVELRYMPDGKYVEF
jgi:hypothetical protein